MSQESASQDSNAEIITEPEYVIVSEREDASSERIELPTDADNTLGLHTLIRAFPNAHGLKFKNPVTLAYRALLIDQTGSKFYPPAGGWQDKTFLVIYQQQTSDGVPKPTSDQNAKRRKIMRDSDDDGKDSSDSEKADKRQRQSSGFAKRLKDDEDATVPTKCSDLIVLGLPFKISEEEVKEYFEQFGTVALVEIKKKSTGASKGFGFIRMETFEGQLKVLNKPVHTIGNRKCQVRVPLAKNGEVRDNPLASAKIFIGRLQEKTTAQQLKEFFLEEAKKIDPEAQILDVYIPKPFRAFAFITFSNPLIVKKMLKIGEFIVDGTSVSVSSAMPKNAQPTNTPGHSSSMSIPPFSRPGAPFSEHGGYNDWHDSSSRLREMDQYGYPSRSRMPPQFAGNYPIPGSSSGAGGSMLATGLETLNLNNMKPEVVNAWKAFLNAATNKSGLSPPPPSSPPHHYASSLPPQYQQQMHNRRNGSSSHGPPAWR